MVSVFEKLGIVRKHQLITVSKLDFPHTLYAAIKLKLVAWSHARPVALQSNYIFYAEPSSRPDPRSPN